MNLSKKVLEEHKIEADKRIAFVCLLMVGFMILVALLNAFGVFKIRPEAVYPTVAVSIVDFILPWFIYRILKKHNSFFRYLIITILVFQSGLLYSILSYHTIIMLVFPLIMACLYTNKHLVLYTIAISIPMIVISHLLAFILKIVPDEPLVTLKGTILYGILPRAIEFLAIGVICYFISSESEKLINRLASKNNELYEEQENLIYSLSQIIENKSENTGQHVRRVSEYTRILCQSLGYNEEETWKISLASMMHDVGKIMVNEEILEKPRKLTDEEFTLVKQHTRYGKHLLATTPGELFELSSIIAYEHHEKRDGSGYIGLKGEEINKAARCVSLVDVFDALISTRPYKKAWKPKEVYDYIVQEGGKSFDPQVVDAFIKNYDKFLEINEKYPDSIKEESEKNIEKRSKIL